MHELKRKILDDLLKTEGGFVDDPADSGGATNFGVTESVARAQGYHGDMALMSVDIARGIYSRSYWGAIRGDDMLLISMAVTREVFDTSVNLGVERAAKFLQRILNVLNRGGLDYGEVVVDGLIGPITLGALQDCFLSKGEGIILVALNCLQGQYYIDLAERHPKNERFVYGWLSNRVLT